MNAKFPRRVKMETVRTLRGHTSAGVTMDTRGVTVKTTRTTVNQVTMVVSTYLSLGMHKN